MRNLTRKLGAVEGSEADLLKAFEFEKELAKVNLVVGFQNVFVGDKHPLFVLIPVACDIWHLVLFSDKHTAIQKGKIRGRL